MQMFLDQKEHLFVQILYFTSNLSIENEEKLYLLETFTSYSLNFF